MPVVATKLEHSTLLELCGVAGNGEHLDEEFVGNLLTAAAAFSKRLSLHDSSVAHASAALVEALSRLPQFCWRHDPTSQNWVNRENVERIAKQLLGLTFAQMDARDVALAVRQGVNEAIELGFVESQSFDAWRPGMSSGSGWIESLRSLSYGVIKARQFVASPPPKQTASAGPLVENSATAAFHAEPRSTRDRQSENQSRKDAFGRERHSILEAAEHARTKASLELLLRQLIREIELWTRELKHGTLVLFEDSEQGQFARALTGSVPNGIQLLPGYIVGDFMLTSWVEDLLELSLTELQVKSFRARIGAFNKLRLEFALKVRPVAAAWNAISPDYDQFAAIDDDRKSLKLAAFDLCQYIDTLAHFASVRAPEPTIAIPDSIPARNSSELPMRAPCDPTREKNTRAEASQVDVPLKLGGRGEPCWVLGKQKPPLTGAQFEVMSALVSAGDEGLTKDSLEVVASSARRILRTLRSTDSDWATIIQMPGRTNVGYRIRRAVHQ